MQVELRLRLTGLAVAVAVALIETARVSVLTVDVHLEQAHSAPAARVLGRVQQPPADALPAPVRHHVELVAAAAACR
jgi:hypothetical protein